MNGVFIMINSNLNPYCRSYSYYDSHRLSYKKKKNMVVINVKLTLAVQIALKTTHTRNMLR